MVVERVQEKSWLSSLSTQLSHGCPVSGTDSISLSFLHLRSIVCLPVCLSFGFCLLVFLSPFFLTTLFCHLQTNQLKKGVNQRSKDATQRQEERPDSTMITLTSFALRLSLFSVALCISVCLSVCHSLSVCRSLYLSLSL